MFEGSGGNDVMYITTWKYQIKKMHSSFALFPMSSMSKQVQKIPVEM